MATDTLPKTLTVAQALDQLVNEWKRDEDKFYKGAVTRFLESLEDDQGELPHGIDYEAVGDAVIAVARRSAMAALEFLAKQEPPVVITLGETNEE